MREEAERIIKAEGWTKAALNSMVKIDSFLRESQRLNGIGAGDPPYFPFASVEPTLPNNSVYVPQSRVERRLPILEWDCPAGAFAGLCRCRSDSTQYL
jgi:hypothetical protein